jgi:hypothetical protein
MFLGGWIISLPLTTFVCVFLVNHGEWVTSIVLCFIVLANWLNISNILLILWFPVSVLLLKKGGLGPVEKAFIAICNEHAKKMGITLNWNQYKSV